MMQIVVTHDRVYVGEETGWTKHALTLRNASLVDVVMVDEVLAHVARQRPDSERLAPLPGPVRIPTDTVKAVIACAW